MFSLIHGYRHYADFTGRDTRRQFWGFILASILIGILLTLPILFSIGHLIAATFHAAIQQNVRPEAPPIPVSEEIVRMIFHKGVVIIIFAILNILWGLANIVPLIATTVRRLRDAGYSPWWVLPPIFTFSPLLPLTGSLSGWVSLLSLVTLVLCCLPGAPAAPAPETAQPK